MTWNYRIIDFGDHLALHEVHYDEAGKPTSYTAEPATFVVDPDCGHEIVSELTMALQDATSKPVLAVGEFN
ncbi:hypothetical protein [Sphingomonas kyungheensis]|uniref:Uncharacterized protein n=1 Tax=Sphingomonas kyungheensis TaxID=1069987 RepID=A0ABU8H425_9SPHN